MSKFAIGDRVDRATDDHESGVVIAVFSTDDGNYLIRLSGPAPTPLLPASADCT